MTDEMTIQQRKSPLVPTVLGAAAGTGIGYGVGHLMTKPMTHEDIIKDINDTTTFSNRVKEGAPEAATWQEVKNKADEVAKLKNALDEAKLGELKDKGLADKITKAENEIEDLISKEMNKGKTNSVSNFVEIKPFDELKPDQISGLKGKNVDAVRNKYNTLYTEYANALSNAQNATAGRYFDAKTQYETVEKAIRDAYVNTAKLADNAGGDKQTLNNIFSSKKTKDFWEKLWEKLGLNGKKTSAYNEFFEAAKKIKPEISDLSNDQIKALGEFVVEKDSKKLPKPDKTQELHKIMNSKNELEGYVLVQKGSKEQAIINLNKEIKNEQKVIADELFGNARKYWELNSKVSNFDTVFAEKYVGNNATASGKNALKRAGLTDLSSLESASKYEQIIKDLKSINSNQLNSNLSQAQENAKNAISASENDLRKLITMAQERMRIAEAKEKELNSIKEQFENIIAKDSRIVDLKSKADIQLRRDSDVKKAFKKLKEAFPGLFPENVANESASEISRDQAIKKLGRTYTDLDDKLKGLKEQAKAAERKAPDPEKVKTAQDAFDAGEKSLKEMAESLGKKITKGPNKWVAAGIGAAALGLATLLAVNSKNNKAQA